MIPILLATWKEIYRRKVFLVTALLTGPLLGLVWLVSWFVERGTSAHLNATNALTVYMNGSIILALGVYGANFSVAYLSIFSAAGTISSEIENGLLLALLPRPIRRWQVYLGKWLGYVLWGMAYTTVVFWLLALTVHLNMHYPLVLPVVFTVYLVLLLLPVILVSLTMLGSTYLSTMGNGICCMLLYGMGVFGDLLERVGFGGQLAPVVGKIGFVTSLIMPTDAVYQRATYEMVGGLGPFVLSLVQRSMNGIVPVVPSGAFIGYAAVYAAVMLLWGAVRFSRRDI